MCFWIYVKIIEDARITWIAKFIFLFLDIILEISHLIKYEAHLSSITIHHTFKLV